MWLCLNNAFLSIVADRNDSSRLLVRSRRREHLTNFFGDDVEIQVNAGTDYKYRTFVDRRTMAKRVADAVEQISYDNFKGSVEDPLLEDLYHRWWADHHAIQK